MSKKLTQLSMNNSRCRILLYHRPINGTALLDTLQLPERRYLKNPVPDQSTPSDEETNCRSDHPGQTPRGRVFLDHPWHWEQIGKIRLQWKEGQDFHIGKVLHHQSGWVFFNSIPWFAVFPVFCRGHKLDGRKRTFSDSYIHPSRSLSEMWKILLRIRISEWDIEFRALNICRMSQFTLSDVDDDDNFASESNFFSFSCHSV